MSNGVKDGNARHNLDVNVDYKGASHTNTMTHTVYDTYSQNLAFLCLINN